MIARGTFDVDLKPLETSLTNQLSYPIYRMSIHKIFRGDLDAISQGEMLSMVTATQDSAGYVALEQVQGSLAGKRGSFALQHMGVAMPGEQRLTVQVVPDSGSDELTGLRGSLTIEIENGLHEYSFDYTLP